MNNEDVDMEEEASESKQEASVCEVCHQCLKLILKKCQL